MVPEGGDPNSAILVMAAEHVRQRHSTGSCIPSEPNTGIRQSPKKPEVQKIRFFFADNPFKGKNEASATEPFFPFFPFKLRRELSFLSDSFYQVCVSTCVSFT